MLRLTAGAVTQSSLAARAKVPRRTTASNARSAFNEGTRLFHNGEPPPGDDGVLVRPAMRRSLNLPAKGITKQLLTPDLTGSLQMLLITVAPGGSSGEDRYSHAGEECGYLLRGQLRLWAGSGEYLLNPGDSFRFQSTLPHRFANPSDGDAEVVWVTTPPFY